jgi:hypothetical protein
VTGGSPPVDLGNLVVRGKRETEPQLGASGHGTIPQHHASPMPAAGDSAWPASPEDYKALKNGSSSYGYKSVSYCRGSHREFALRPRMSQLRKSSLAAGLRFEYRWVIVKS